MNTVMLRSSLYRLLTAMLVGLTAVRAVDVETVNDALVQKALKATVAINTYTGSGTGRATLGFFASAEGLVVTTAFSVEGAQKLTLFLADGSTITDARFLGMDENKRLAVLETNRKAPAFLEVCGKAPAAGDACAVIGLQRAEKSFQAASGQLLARHPGLNVSESQFVDTWNVAARHDCLLDGGAVVSSSGQVIGVCWAAEFRKQWVMRAVTDADIRAALGRALQNKKPAPYPRLGEINPTLASPAQSDTSYIEGMRSMQQGDYPEAIQKLKDTLLRHPNDPQTLLILASCYSQNGQNDDFAKCTEELGRTGVKLWSSRIAIAGMLIDAGNHSAASEYLHALLKEEPRLGNAWNWQADALFALGRKQEALHAAKRSVELEPEFLQHWATLTDILLDLGNLSAYQKARERADDLESLLFKLDHLPLRGLKVN